MKKLSFANLTITFGDKELLDYKEIVTAAFLVDTHVRTYGKTRYHFLDVQLVQADPNDLLSLVISGKFVKDTLLEREQVLDNGSLVSDKQSLRSSPSAFFCFFLADHRLAFLAETKHAPKLENFHTTIEAFIKDEFKKFIDQIYETTKKIDPSYTRKKVFKDYSPPTISLVPLTSRESIEAFIGRFSHINSLTIHVIKRNQDTSGGNIFESLYDKVLPLEPTSAKFVANAGKEGLVINETKELVADATAGGYEQATIKGKDTNGAQLSGSNRDFSLSVSIDVDGMSTAEKSKTIYAVYNDQKKSGNIRVTPRDPLIVGPLLSNLKESYDKS